MSEKRSIVDIANSMNDTTRERVCNALLRAGEGELAGALAEPQQHTDAHEAIALAQAETQEWKDVAASRRTQLERAAKELGEAKSELAHASATLAEQRAELDNARTAYTNAGAEISELQRELEKHRA